MTEHVFEGSTLDLRAVVARGRPRDGAARFVFEQQGGEARLDATTAPFSGGAAVQQVVLPRVKDDEDSYTLSVKVEADGDTFAGGHYTVWPRTIRLEVTDDEERAQAECPIECEEELDPGQAAPVSGPDGALELRPATPGPVTLSVGAPFGLLGWRKEKGRLRRLWVTRKGYPVELLSPSPGEAGATPASIATLGPGDPIRQFVNLAPEAGALRAGSILTVQVAGRGDAARPERQRLGREGDEVFVRVTFTSTDGMRDFELDTTGGWTADHPEPALLDAAGAPIAPDGIGRSTTRLRLGPGGAPASCRIQLGLHGGDRCTVEVGGTDACADAKVTVVNWRKVYYQLTRAAGLAIPSLEPFEQAYARVFVEPERYETLVIPDGPPGSAALDEGEAEAPAPPAGSWLDASVFDPAATGRHLVVGYHNVAFFQGLFDDARAPVGTHVVLMHQQYNARDVIGADLIEAQDVAVGTGRILFPPGTAALARGVRLKTQEPERSVLPVDLTDGGSPVRSCSWRSEAEPSRHGTVPLDDAHLAFGPGGQNRSIHVKLPAAAAAWVDAGDTTIRIAIEYRYAIGIQNGFALAGQSFTRAHRPGPGSGDMGTNTTIAHELGHLMGLAPRRSRLPPGLTMKAHGKTYFAGGWHCGDGSEEDFEDELGLDGHPSPIGARCMMYGVSTRLRDWQPRLCDRCARFALAEPLRKLDAL